jgi:predicted oxidoreductase (fatty acid repression mutant protein)
MLSENDLKQIKNLVLSYYKEKKYFPFADDLMNQYKIFFPDDLDQEIKNQIDDLVNSVILEQIEAKNTKGGQIMMRILQNNDKLWKEFRKLNSKQFFEDKKFQELGKQIEKLIFE